MTLVFWLTRARQFTWLSAHLLSWPHRRRIPVRLEVRKQLPFASGSDFYYDSFHYASDPGKVLLCCIHLCHLFQFSGWIVDYFNDSWNPKSRKGRWKGFRRWIADAVFRSSALISPPLSGRGPILSFHFYTPPPSGGLRIYPLLFTSYKRGIMSCAPMASPSTPETS